MTNAIEGLIRGDGRIALFHGDRFLGHFSGGDFTAAGGNGGTPDRGNGTESPGPKRRAKAARKGASRVPTADAAPARKGRKPSYSPAQETRVVKLLKRGQSVNTVAKEMGMSWHVVNTIRTRHADELASGTEPDGDDDTEDDPALPRERVRSPPQRAAQRTLRRLSERPLPLADDDVQPPLNFYPQDRVPTDGLDLEAIDQVVAEAVRGGRIPEDPARRRAMELWDDGWRGLEAIAEECQVALATVHYWHAKDDWACRRGRQGLKTA